MGNIRILDPITANQIAAGEVVERPSSVVKELVENAIDAGSTRIDVEIRNGGIDYIRVTDNGQGMSAKDALLAFERHATSKIAAVEDLSTLGSLGFRGEALPSIASVSRVEMTTRQADSLSAFRLEISGGKLLGQEEIGAPRGTSIIVRDLFYNTPARKKHLKTLGTEGGWIAETLSNLALAWPGICFTLSQGGRRTLQTPGSGKLLDAIISLQGTGVAKSYLGLEAETDLFKVRGYLGLSEVSRTTRSQQLLFVNGRYVRSKLVSQAVEQGYHTRLMVGRYPVFVLQLQINPSLVDVNVHPTKMEVRFSEERELQEFLTQAVIRRLGETAVIPGVVAPPVRPVEITRVVQEKLEEVSKEPEIQQELFSRRILGIGLPEFEAKSRELVTGSRAEKSPAQQDQVYATVGSGVELSIPAVSTQEVRESAPPLEASVNDFSQLNILGQLDNTYIIATGAQGLYIFDQHAVHERILYERFLAGQKEGQGLEVPAQILLNPLSVELAPLEAELLVRNILLYRELGFTMEHFGGRSFLIRTVPQGLAAGAEIELFYELLDNLRENNHHQVDRLKLKEDLIILQACKAAIKAWQPLTQPVMEDLLRQLGSVSNPYNCPHGRPTVLKYTGGDLAKAFKRT
ncbi:MAG TPA: DNA mismatch repair endonuclease MutL [Bacillota bacterium]|nr:DNA mismatch repair endonuclease MutL [Bacillota bacterium]